MKKGILALLTAAVLVLPLATFAADHGGMNHGGMNHSGMQMKGSVIELVPQTVDGVIASVHLKDVKDAMAKMGMKQTHHFMVAFEDENGEDIIPEVVAVKVTDPTGAEGKPVELMTMKGGAGADLILATPGTYKFKVAAKLAKGKKLQYEFTYTFK